ncbi:MAG: hypothetical protein GC180_02115 [Bacteroidetes bacterium]|nr:hypothetical protein [Bacteroidota bacterium]
MKKLVLTLILLSPAFVKAQSRLDTLKREWFQQAKESCVQKIASEDLVFKRQEIPAEWSKSSAIILSSYAKYFAYSSKEGYRIGQYSLDRILLRDEYALEDFSSFALDDESYLNVRVIKSDGSVIELDHSREVYGEYIYTNGNTGKSWHYLDNRKIPVPGLEFGDIIEIERYGENIKFNSKGKVIYPTSEEGFFIMRMHESFPILQRTVDFEIGSPFELKWKAMNQAPVLKEVSRNENRITYRLTDGKRKNLKPEYWSTKSSEEPYVKVAFSKAREELKGEILSENKEYDPSWLLPYINEIRKDRELSQSGVALDFAKDNFMGTFKFSGSVARKFYSYYRSECFLNQHSISYEMSDAHFLAILSRVLDKFKVKYEWMAAVPKELGTWKDVVSADEVYLGIRVKQENEIYTEFDPYSTYNELDPSIQGTNAVFIDFQRSEKHPGLRFEELPESGPKDNLLTTTWTLSIDGTRVNAERKNAFTGQSRFSPMEYLPHTLLFDDDYKRLYGKNYALGIVSSHPFIERRDLWDRMEEVADRYWHDDLKYAEKQLTYYFRNRNYGFEDYSFVRLNDPARELGSPELVFTDKMTLNSLLGESDTIKIFHIGRLLGETIYHLDAEDSIRQTGIMMRTPQTVKTVIILKDAAKYSYSGLRYLDTTVENEAGSFSVSHTIHDEQVEIIAIQTFTGQRLGANKWNDVLDLVQCVAETNRKKLLVTKKAEQEKEEIKTTDDGQSKGDKVEEMEGSNDE